LTFGNVQTAPVNVGSDHWLDEFAVDEQQFEDSGRGEDGGQFGFDDNPVFDEDENQNEIQTKDDLDESDAWMTKLTQMDNPLQGVPKAQKKINKKGKSMAQMQSKQPDLTGTFDDNFLKTINAGLTGQTISTPQQQTIQPNQPLYGSGSDPFSTFGNAAPNQPLSGYNHQAQSNVFYGNNMMGSTPMRQTNNDPFFSLASQANKGPVPATYQKPERGDPFSNLNWK